MRPIKSERLKKLEKELEDLKQWLNLGLVPKKDIKKHHTEIKAIEERIAEEKERLQFLKESGDFEYTAPKRQQRTAYTEMPSLPDIDPAETSGHSEGGFDVASDSEGSNSIISESDDTDEADDSSDDDMADEESYFSERNRWRRGGIVDPDADDW